MTSLFSLLPYYWISIFQKISLSGDSGRNQTKHTMWKGLRDHNHGVLSGVFISLESTGPLERCAIWHSNLTGM